MGKEPPAGSQENGQMSLAGAKCDRAKRRDFVPAAPHLPSFIPLATVCRRRNHGIEVTARDATQGFSWSFEDSVLRMSFPRDFPGGAVVGNPPANAGDMGSSPGPGRSHMPRSN